MAGCFAGGLLVIAGAAFALYQLIARVGGNVMIDIDAGDD